MNYSSIRNTMNNLNMSTLGAVLEKNENEGYELASNNDFHLENIKLDLKKENKNENKNENTTVKKEFTLEDLDTPSKQKLENKENSTQKKSIFYYSFKNIRDRYQYKEQRINKIQIRNEKILKEIKEVKLPKINNKK